MGKGRESSSSDELAFSRPHLVLPFQHNFATSLHFLIAYHFSHLPPLPEPQLRNQTRRRSIRLAFSKPHLQLPPSTSTRSSKLLQPSFLNNNRSPPSFVPLLCDSSTSFLDRRSADVSSQPDERNRSSFVAGSSTAAPAPSSPRGRRTSASSDGTSSAGVVESGGQVGTAGVPSRDSECG